jgi:hypothetical protein
VIVDMGHRVNQITETAARRRVWCEREPELYARARELLAPELRELAVT